jgi:hypothetical protein
MLPQPNTHKNLIIDLEGTPVARYPVKTKVLEKGDDIPALVEQYTKAYLPDLEGKRLIVAIGEKAVSAAQGRAIPITDVHPSWLANFLVKFVTKSKVGIGLGVPHTMELAIREVGVPRILLATFIAAITRPFGFKGMFYNIAGHQARSIDGPADYVIPPYNKAAVMGAKDPDKVAQAISDKLGGIPAAIIDANDIGQNVIGASGNADSLFIKKAFKDNPLGSSREQTPIAILAW